MVRKFFARKQNRLAFGVPTLLTAIFLWTVGLILFVARIPDVVEDPDTRTDGIVVLTGGSMRLETGLDLLENAKADKVLVSGVYRGVDLKRLLELSRNDPSGLECCVEIGHEADDTTGNAVETAEWVRKNNYRTLRLVTGSYHMPRSLLEFSFHLPGITLVPHPVFPEAVRVDDWWQWPGTASLLISEYNKYLLVSIRQGATRLMGETPQP